MKNISIFLWLFVSVVAISCNKYSPNVDFTNPGGLVGKINEHFSTEQQKFYCYRDGRNYVTPTTDNPSGCTGSVSDGSARAKTVRDGLIEAALPFIDDAYEQFITSIESGRSRTNFVADVIELGTSSAIGFTKGQRVVQILGISLTGFRGVRRSADLNFYKDQTVPILINKMDDNRSKIHAAILQREQSDIGSYPIGEAIKDIVSYYNAGTLIRAFTELSKETATQAKQSEANVQEIKKQLSKPASADDKARATNALASLRRLDNSVKNGSAKEKQVAIRTLQAIVASLEGDKDIKSLLNVTNVTSKEEDGTKLLSSIVTIRRAALDNLDFQNKINEAVSTESADTAVVARESKAQAQTAEDTLQAIEESLSNAVQKDAAVAKLQAIVAALEQIKAAKDLLKDNTGPITHDEKDGKRLVEILRSMSKTGDNALRDEINQTIVEKGK